MAHVSGIFYFAKCDCFCFMTHPMSMSLSHQKYQTNETKQRSVAVFGVFVYFFILHNVAAMTCQKIKIEIVPADILCGQNAYNNCMEQA